MPRPDGIGEAAAFLLSRIKINILFEQNNNVLLLYSYTQKHRCKSGVFYLQRILLLYFAALLFAPQPYFAAKPNNEHAAEIKHNVGNLRRTPRHRKLNVLIRYGNGQPQKQDIAGRHAV